MTQAIRPAASVELQVAALPVALKHALLRGAVAVVAPAHLRVQARLAVSLPAVLPVQVALPEPVVLVGQVALPEQVVLVGQVVPLAESAHQVRLLVALPAVVVHRLALRAVATTGH